MSTPPSIGATARLTFSAAGSICATTLRLTAWTQAFRYDISRNIVDDYRGLGASVAFKKRHVLLIGIDGTRPDALLAAKPPNLSALIAEGTFSDKAQAGDITNSGPGWATVLTGT